MNLTTQEKQRLSTKLELENPDQDWTFPIKNSHWQRIMLLPEGTTRDKAIVWWICRQRQWQRSYPEAAAQELAIVDFLT